VRQFFQATRTYELSAFKIKCGLSNDWSDYNKAAATAIHLISLLFFGKSQSKVIASAKEVMFWSLFVCLSVSNFAQKKIPNGFA